LKIVIALLLCIPVWIWVLQPTLATWHSIDIVLAQALHATQGGK
jgi:hypothetical protein